MAAKKKSRLNHAVLVGAGRMGSAMARGWLGDLAGAGIGRLSVVEPAPGDDVKEAAAAGHVARRDRSARRWCLIRASTF